MKSITGQAGTKFLKEEIDELLNSDDSSVVQAVRSSKIIPNKKQ
jgi:hypothetical protein